MKIDLNKLFGLKSRIAVVTGGGGELGGSFSPPERVRIEDLVNVAKVYALAGIDICTKTRSEIEPQLKLPV